MDYHADHQIPMSSPDLTEAEIQAVTDVLRSTSLSMGPNIQAFEAAFRAAIGVRHAIAVNSGTAGLHLCVRAAGIQPGERVITTPFSFVASTNVLLFEGAVPVFVDIDPVSGNIDPELVRQAAADLSAGESTAKKWLPRQGAPQGGALKAILAVDVFGQPAEYDAIRPVATTLGLGLIEDACEALGSEYKGRKAGRLGDTAVFAFYPNKQITTGEGGMIVTDDDAAAEMMRALRNQGRAPGDTWLDHTHLGYNYRLDEMSSALGAAQMRRLDDLLAKRRQVADWYGERLAEIPWVEAPALLASTTRMGWFVYVIRVAPGIDRTMVTCQLESAGIPSRPYFSPIHLQPYMVQRFGYRSGDFPVTEDLAVRGLALPFSSVMTEEQVAVVCKVLSGLI
ncbi:MAG: DegT/DnrJ/EryC1/StrS family aminotransferase [Anaerolineae bacterium]|nr:DegT/DnrJ/EryC1/StrS family aminotransferase [Anaerolineae bacterium]